MNVFTDNFNAIWMPSVTLGDFGTLQVERRDKDPITVHGVLRPRGEAGLIRKAEYYIKEKDSA